MTWHSLLVCIGLPAKGYEAGNWSPLSGWQNIHVHVCMCYCFTVSALCFMWVTSAVLPIVVHMPGQNIAYWWRWIYNDPWIVLLRAGMNSEISLSLYLWDTYIIVCRYSLNCLLLPIVLPPQGVWMFDRSSTLCIRSVLSEIDCVDHVHPHLNALLLPCLVCAVVMEAL